MSKAADPSSQPMPISSANAAAESAGEPAAEVISERPTPPLPGTGQGAARGRLTARSYGITDMGQLRSHNEDQFLIAQLTKALQVQQTSLPQPQTRYSDEPGYLFIVADGMGGRHGGEQASALAMGTVEEFALNTLKWFFHLRSEEEQNVLAEFQEALRQADMKILAEGSRHPELKGMGTTLTMAYCASGQLFVVHVGGSRCYLQRGGRLYRLTRDHTLVEEMVRHQVLTPEQAARHYLRHIVTSSVGGHRSGLQVEAHRVTLAAGDVMLLCSDGLTEMLPDDVISAILSAEPEPKAACRHLVEEANARISQDNITVIVARFDADS